MTTRHATVLVNRSAGSGRRLSEVATFVKELSRLGWRVDVVAPVVREDVVPAIEHAVRGGTDCLIVAGGDGTWHSVLQAEIVHASSRPSTHEGDDSNPVPLALLPIGTGDDNARSLSLPISDPAATAHLVNIGSTRLIDLGLVHSGSTRRWFSGVLSVGFDSQVNARANHYRRLPGTFRYLTAAAVELMRFTPGTYTISTPAQTLNQAAMLIAVGNGGHYGGGMAICPEFSHTDGELEITIIGELSRGRFVATLPTVYSGRHVRQPGVTTLRGPVVDIDSDDQLVFADGEYVGRTPIRIECVPRALRIIAA